LSDSLGWKYSRVTGAEAAIIAGAVGARSAIVSAALAAVGTNKVTDRSISAEDRRSYARQVHLANVARADRLREIYGRMAQASVALKRVIVERGYLLEGETEPERVARHQQRIGEILSRAGELGGQILVESTAEPVRSAYQLVANVTTQYMMVERHEPAPFG
jgi:hypothetical protein